MIVERHAIKGASMGFCLWERQKKNGTCYYETECGQIYMGYLSHGNHIFCPFCKGYVISAPTKKGKCYTEQERMFDNDTL